MSFQHEQRFGMLFITTNLIGAVMKVLGVVWLIAIILQLPKQVRMFLRDREILQGNVPVEMEGAEELFREVCKELGIRRKIRLFANDACYSPVRIRIVRPAVLLPYGMECDEQELRMIFIHELTHYLHHDLAYKVACFLICIIHWFNPCVRNLVEHYEEWAETACDVSTCEKGKRYFTKTEYALMLLRHAEEDNGDDPEGHVLSLYSNDNEIERRINRLKTVRNIKKPLPKAMLAILTAVLFVGNSIPAFAVGDMLANGYEEVYESTSEFLAESQKVKMTISAEGFKVNEAGEIEIPADEVNPEGLPEIVMEGDNKAEATKFYNWDIPANTYGRSFEFTCKSGSRIAIMGKFDQTIQAGIIEPNGNRRCVIDSSVISHTFTLDQAGTYNFYVKNTNDFEIHVEVSVAY
ncbi:M56 family metallopeptidase [Cuneatibacter sp. NSJ-177]|uniref:M56 family metallopeptidase n=1 Tax=Cuneatibacter sp. NSJ-177 TaxID=2931401 RepID=UPI001FD1BBF3|nr:M56 family metallopeptidase [Cuneatibacter sp. NSJ-177]MCJ7835471.1 M56 family metallopeptidase [Cuneatibacter sp. NSJ-177]